jgi:hypothetical protein
LVGVAFFFGARAQNQGCFFHEILRLQIWEEPRNAQHNGKAVV